MKKTFLTIGLLLAIAFMPALASAQSRGFGGRGPKGPGKMHKGGQNAPGAGMVLMLKDKLALSDEQVKQLKAIREETKDQHKAAAEAVKAKQQALREAVEAGADESAIRTAAAQIGTTIGNQAVLKAAARAKIHAILTDSQQVQLNELKAQHKEQRQERQGPRRQGRNEEGKGRRRSGGKDPETVFEKIDTDGNGSVSLEEFAEHMEQMKDRFGSNGPRGKGRDRSRHGGPDED